MDNWTDEELARLIQAISEIAYGQDFFSSIDTDEKRIWVLRGLLYSARHMAHLALLGVRRANEDQWKQMQEVMQDWPDFTPSFLLDRADGQ